MNCPVETNVVPRPPRAARRLAWLHFPKCSSSVTSLLYNYACQSTSHTNNVVYAPGSHAMELKLRSRFRRNAVVYGYEDPLLRAYKDQTCPYCWDTCETYPACTRFTLWVRLAPAANPQRCFALGTQ
jgi:hypothetical protein